MAYSICTALIQRSTNTADFEATASQRLALLDVILTQLHPTDVLILPGGYFNFRKKPLDVYKWVKEHLPPLVKQHSPNTVVAVGLDINIGGQRHELAVAISKSKIKAAARKFQMDLPTKADGPWEKEAGWNRTFTKKGKRYYLAICNDIFGLRRRKVGMELPVHAVLNTIHYFSPAGEDHGGDVQFARHGLAGAAHHWKRPVFGAAHFLRPQIPENWPSGVKWKRGLADDYHWTYADNTLKPQQIDSLRVKVGSDTAELRYYQF
ncbi:hypothetical protein ACW9KT_09075 [Hymenobacter sp. HD11105]